MLLGDICKPSAISGAEASAIALSNYSVRKNEYNDKVRWQGGVRVTQHGYRRPCIWAGASRCPRLPCPDGYALYAQCRQRYLGQLIGKHRLLMPRNRCCPRVPIPSESAQKLLPPLAACPLKHQHPMNTINTDLLSGKHSPRAGLHLVKSLEMPWIAFASFIIIRLKLLRRQS